jgi:hypothetical protein
MPFSLAGLRFAPQAVQTVSVHSGVDLPLVFQIWLPRKEATPDAKVVHLHYLIGSVAEGGKPLDEFDETIDASDADAVGNLVTGHTMSTSNLSVGSYQLVVKATIDGDPNPAFSTLTLLVVPAEIPVDQWTAHSGEQTAIESADDLKRGLSAEALGHTADAEVLYANALQTDPAQLRAFVRLAAVLAAQDKTPELAKLSDSALTAQALPPDTLMLIAGAVRDTGNLQKAIRLVTAQMSLQAPNAPIYELLASMYDATGDRSKADTLRAQEKTVSPAPPVPARP